MLGNWSYLWICWFILLGDRRRLRGLGGGVGLSGGSRCRVDGWMRLLMRVLERVHVETQWMLGAAVLGY